MLNGGLSRREFMGPSPCRIGLELKVADIDTGHGDNNFPLPPPSLEKKNSVHSVVVDQPKTCIRLRKIGGSKCWDHCQSPLHGILQIGYEIQAL